MAQRSLWQRVRRVLELVSGVHRIHDIRYAYGYKLPFIKYAYFPPWKVRDGSNHPATRRYGWKRVLPTTYHDCTKTGRP